MRRTGFQIVSAAAAREDAAKARPHNPEVAPGDVWGDWPHWDDPLDDPDRDANHQYASVALILVSAAIVFVILSAGFGLFLEWP